MKRHFTSPLFVASAVLLCLVLAVFGDLLFFPHGRIVSRWGHDLSTQFYYFRAYGMEQLLHGSVALWNPHIACGTPFAGYFQSALFYLPNIALYALLPLVTAINAEVALHVFLAGFFTFLWLRLRQLHVLSSLFGAGILMFSGAFFMHVYPGHLSNIATASWLPLLLLAIDGYLRERSFGWWLAGLVSVTMQILAGHVQYVYYGAIAAFFYVVFQLPFRRASWLTLAGFLGMYAGAACLSAVQLLTGIGLGAETVRGSSMPFAYTSMFSFPPENLLTLLSPWLLGGGDVPYWGRWYFWEVSLFTGVTGAFFAVYGAAAADSRTRRVALLMIALLLLLALGSYTPLYSFFYYYVPFFARFRGSAKFIYPATLFIVLLSATGFDALVRSVRASSRLMTAAAVSGIVLALAAAGLQHGAAGTLWRSMMQAVYAPYSTLLSDAVFQSAAFARTAALHTAVHLYIAAGTLLVLAVLLLVRRRHAAALYGMLALGLVEVAVFALSARPSFNEARLDSVPLRQFAVAHPGDYRVLVRGDADAAMVTGMKDISGFDCNVFRRYGEFVAFTQGKDPDALNQYLSFTRTHPALRLLGWRYVLDVVDGTPKTVLELPDVLPPAWIAGDWKVARGRDALFAGMGEKDFDCGRTALLEQEPFDGATAARGTGTARLVSAAGGKMTIEAEVTGPSVLVVSSSYSAGWRARALPGSAQTGYRVVPADYVLCGVPLSKGRHLLELEYRPKEYVIGKWVSILSLALLVAGTLVYIRRNIRNG